MQYSCLTVIGSACGSIRARSSAIASRAALELPCCRPDKTFSEKTCRQVGS